MNVWCFTGNVGQDAEVRFTSGGDPITNFSVAVKAGYGQKATTTWVRCAIFGKRGEAVSPYLLKGTQVGVSGEASMREWEAKDGGKRFSLEVRVNDVTLLGGKKPEGERTERPAAPSEAQSTAVKAPAGNFNDMDDDIPF
jgi:single-strand DNA-binding protein